MPWLDIIVIMLLSFTIVHFWKINKKIHAIQSGKKELAQLIQQFDTIIIRANTSINTLKDICSTTPTSLDKQIFEAKDLLEELKLLIDKGGIMADNLNNTSSKNKTVTNNIQPNTPPISSFPKLTTSNMNQDQSNDRVEAIESLINRISTKNVNDSNNTNPSTQEILNVIQTTHKKGNTQ